MTLFLLADERNGHGRATLNGVAQRLQREAPLVLIAPYQPGIHAEAALIVSDFPSGLRDTKTGPLIADELVENIDRLNNKADMWVAGVILASFDSELIADDSGPGLTRLNDKLHGRLPVWRLDLQQASWRRPLPEELQSVLQKVDTVHDIPELLALPTYVEAAGGSAAAGSFAQVGIERHKGDSKSFVAEVILAMKGALSMWGYEAAVSWLGSSNAFLDGARPIQILAVRGPERVLDSLNAESQFVYS